MLRPLKYMRVWRFSLYYVVVFGVYVALSVWLPKYYVDVYKMNCRRRPYYRTHLSGEPAQTCRRLSFG